MSFPDNQLINKSNRSDWNQVFKDILTSLTKRCTCLKLKTAALIIKGNMITIGQGYNGTFSKSVECDDHWKNYYITRKNNLEEGEVFYETFQEFIKSEEFADLHREWSLENEIHAEMNALSCINKFEKDCVMYTLYSPCNNCAKIIICYGIKKVYYVYKYKHGAEAIKTLIKNGIECVQI